MFPSGDARHQCRTYNGSRTMVAVAIISHAVGSGRKSTCVFHACPSSLIFLFSEKTYERMGGLTAKFGIDNIEHTKFSFEVSDHGPFSNLTSESHSIACSS